jgi:hypothetical protein
MEIRPHSPGPQHRAGTGRAKESTSGAAGVPVPSDAHAPAPPVRSRTDRVEISSAVRSLESAAAAEAVPARVLAPERLREITERMQSGYYQESHVIDGVINGLLADLTGHTPRD